MVPDWKSFLLLRLPAALLALALVVEGIAVLLSGVPRLRHPLDARAIEASQPGPESSILLVGDSVTQDVAKVYDLGGVSRVRDLTANKSSSIFGTYLLLRRYLSVNPPPQVLAFAMTPEFAGYVPDLATAEVYLMSVFERPEEQSYLYEMGLSGRSGTWRPAILSPEGAIFDRMVALTADAETPVQGYRQPRPDPPEESAAEVSGAVPIDQIRERMGYPPILEVEAAQAWADICTLASQEGMSIMVRWAPLPETVWIGWTEDGQLSRLAEGIRAVGDGECGAVEFDDFNVPQRYPDIAFRDRDHLRLPGWTGWYASELADWLRELERQ